MGDTFKETGSHDHLYGLTPDEAGTIAQMGRRMQRVLWRRRIGNPLGRIIGGTDLTAASHAINSPLPTDEPLGEIEELPPPDEPPED